MNKQQEKFFLACFDKAMQNFTSQWNDEINPPDRKTLMSGFMLAASLYCFCEKYQFIHKEFEHAATLLNQAAIQLGLEERF